MRVRPFSVLMLSVAGAVAVALHQNVALLLSIAVAFLLGLGRAIVG